MRNRRDQPLPPLDEENKISLRPHQPLGRGRTVEIRSDQLLDLARLKPDVTPEPGDVAIEQNQIAVHRSLRAKDQRCATVFGFWAGRLFALNRSWMVGNGSLPRFTASIASVAFPRFA